MENEKRLIDANAFLDEALKQYTERERGRDLLYTACEVKQNLADMICEAPTVDAVEVVHGHWVSLTECANAGVYCSVCNKKVYKEDYAWCNRKNRLRSDYCPNCGADMRERKDNENTV